MKNLNTKFNSIAAFILSASAATSDPAYAADFTWNGANGDWTLGSNWTPLGPPGALDAASINAGNAQLDSNETILAFTQSGGAVLGTGTLSVTAASGWTGGIQGGAGTSAFSVLGITGANVKSIGGRTVNAGDTTWSGNTGNNNNAINISGAGIFNSTGTFTDGNLFDSSINRGNGGGTFNNQGVFNKQSNTTTAIGVAFNNTGTVNVNAGTMRVASGLTNQGVLSVAAGAIFSVANPTFINAGTLQGNGTYQTNSATAILNNAGTLAPGIGDVGALTIAGDYKQTAAGIFEVQLSSPSSFDSVNVVGNLILDGAIHVASVGGYNPTNDEEFEVIRFDDGVLDATDLTGIFSHIEASGFTPGTTFKALYFDHSVVLKASIAPVPLPSSAILLVLGLMGLTGVVRRSELER